MSIKENFIKKMEQFIQEQQLLKDENRVCCALSGGADSVALLVGMIILREKLSLEVSAIHVNHCLRGAESDGDEQFCRELCERIGVTLHVHRCDVNAYREKTVVLLKQQQDSVDMQPLKRKMVLLQQRIRPLIIWKQFAAACKRHRTSRLVRHSGKKRTLYKTCFVCLKAGNRGLSQ